MRINRFDRTQVLRLNVCFILSTFEAFAFSWEMQLIIFADTPVSVDHEQGWIRDHHNVCSLYASHLFLTLTIVRAEYTTAARFG